MYEGKHYAVPPQGKILNFGENQQKTVARPSFCSFVGGQDNLSKHIKLKTISPFFVFISEKLIFNIAEDFFSDIIRGNLTFDFANNFDIILNLFLFLHHSFLFSGPSSSKISAYTTVCSYTQLLSQGNRLLYFFVTICSTLE